jgi:hypothetical protein
VFELDRDALDVVAVEVADDEDADDEDEDEADEVDVTVPVELDAVLDEFVKSLLFIGIRVVVIPAAAAATAKLGIDDNN